MSREDSGRRILFRRHGLERVELLLDIYDQHDMDLLLEQLCYMDDGERAEIEMRWDDEEAEE